MTVCVRCVMDGSDPDIRFDADGVCNHCHTYDGTIRDQVPPPQEAEARLAALVAEIKRAGEGQPYDCIIGLSGGVDSSYVALLTKELGLRPLAVHVDNGWDSELAVKNIEQIVTRLGIDLRTDVLDWEEFRDLQLSFLRASTPDSEIPTDHAIVSSLYRAARTERVRFILSGCNARTEGHSPPAWSQGHSDWRYIAAVQRAFGTRPLRTFPHRGWVRRKLDAREIRWIDVLNLVDYRKLDAMKTLTERVGWRPYPSKHFESIYTRFYQGHLLPTKFGFDKRRAHLSSLICSGEITRDTALEQLKLPPYPPSEQDADRDYVMKKLGIDAAAFAAIMSAPKRTIADFPNESNSKLIAALRGARALVRRLSGR